MVDTVVIVVNHRIKHAPNPNSRIEPEQRDRIGALGRNPSTGTEPEHWDGTRALNPNDSVRAPN
jgi:hypothetical protein